MTWLHDFLANQATAQSAGNGEVYPPIRTGPQSAIRATSPASPYARDRVQAPSNRPAPRTPTLRSRTQDVIRSAPGALTAARERSLYDTTPQDLVRGAQELTGLPSLARGAGALAALPALVRTGTLGTEHIAPGAMAVGETALGLLGPMSLPRGAARAPALANVAEEPAARIPNMAREIGPNGMPVAQSQPTRNSFRGGSSDLREAAGMRTPPPTTPTGTAPFGDPRAYPPQAWDDFGSLQGGTPEARLRAQEQGFDTGRVLYHGTRSDFDAFDASMSRTGDVPLGVHLGTTPDQANTVNTTGRIERNRTGMDYVEGARNMPVYARVSNPLRMEDPTNWGTNEILSQIAWNDPPISIPKPSYDVTPTDIRDAIRGAGYDSIVYRNAHEGAGDSYIVLPDADGQVRNIRSIFAAFDPAKRDSSDLLAASAAATPIPIAAHALTQQQNTTGRPRGRPGFFGANR